MKFAIILLSFMFLILHADDEGTQESDIDNEMLQVFARMEEENRDSQAGRPSMPFGSMLDKKHHHQNQNDGPFGSEDRDDSSNASSVKKGEVSWESPTIFKTLHAWLFAMRPKSYPYFVRPTKALPSRIVYSSVNQLSAALRKQISKLQLNGVNVDDAAFLNESDILGEMEPSTEEDEDEEEEEDRELSYCDICSCVAIVVLLIQIFRYRASNNHLVQSSMKSNASEKKLELSNENKRKFLRYILHELRVPFHVVDVGLQSLTQETDLPEKVQSLVLQMSEASNMMLALMNDALDLQRIEDGRFEACLGPFDPAKMLKYIINAHSLRTVNKKITMDLEQLGLAGKVLAISDENRIRQCVSNLVDNAIKFSPVGGNVTLECCIENAVLTISVRDQGPGISDADKKKLFETWSQINAGVLQKGKGSGLGLSLVKTIMTVLGGECKVTSIPGQGACFVLSIPVQILPIVSLTAGNTPRSSGSEVGCGQEEEKYSVEGLNILVVDDVALVRAVTGRLLTQYGATVDQAGDGKEAVEKVAQALEKMNPYDLVLMDKEMPIMDGYEATEEVSKTVPVFGMTANAFVEDAIEFKRHGAMEVLTKPLKFDLLLHAVAKRSIKKKLKIMTPRTPLTKWPSFA